MNNYNLNLILVHPLKNCLATTIAEEWKTLYNRLVKHGHQTNMFILDGFSDELKNALQQKNLRYQLVPSHIHRQNEAEQVI